MLAEKPSTKTGQSQRAFGELVHAVIGGAVARLNPLPGFARANAVEIAEAIDASAAEILSSWPVARSVPPPVLWKHTVGEAARRSAKGLAADTAIQPDTRCWTEVPFGQREPSAAGEAPWDCMVVVPIGDTGLRLRGRIDRLDLRANGSEARVTDYKSGRPPDSARRIVLDRGRELQRVLYALAVKALLPEVTSVRTRLMYLVDEPATHVLTDEALETALRDALGYLASAMAILRSGRIAPRWENDVHYDDMRLALPADREAYLRHKQSAFHAANVSLEKFWRAA